MTAERPLFTTREAAEYLQVHEMTMYRMMKKGLIKGFKVGGRWRVRKDVLEALGKETA